MRPIFFFFFFILVLIFALLPSSMPVNYDSVSWEIMSFDNSTLVDGLGMHRSLFNSGRQRYISYQALAANNIPCNRRGNSYYNCRVMAKANPYTRGCTVIARCARDNS